MKAILLQCLFILVLLFLIDYATIKNGSISGNGNPALLFEFPLLILLIWFAVSWTKWLIHLSISLSIRVIVAVFSLGFLVYGTIHTYGRFAYFRAELIEKVTNKYGRVNMQFIDIVTSGITIYTNNLYFNAVTFMMFVSLLNIVAFIVYLAKRRKTAWKS